MSAGGTNERIGWGGRGCRGPCWGALTCSALGVGMKAPGSLLHEANTHSNALKAPGSLGSRGTRCAPRHSLRSFLRCLRSRGSPSEPAPFIPTLPAGRGGAFCRPDRRSDSRRLAGRVRQRSTTRLPSRFAHSHPPGTRPLIPRTIWLAGRPRTLLSVGPCRRPASQRAPSATLASRPSCPVSQQAVVSREPGGHAHRRGETRADERRL